MASSGEPQKSLWAQGYEAGYAQAQKEFSELMDKASLTTRPEKPNPRKGVHAPPGRRGLKGKNNGSIASVHRNYG